MTPEDIGALRVLLARGKAAGWDHRIYTYANSPGHIEHVWVRNDDSVYGARVSVWGGMVNVDIPECSRPWHVPVVSVAQVAAVVELAGALPPVEIEPWSDFVAAAALIEKPGCWCEYVDIGVGSQKVYENPECPRCTSDGLAHAVMSVLVKHGWKPPKYALGDNESESITRREVSA